MMTSEAGMMPREYGDISCCDDSTQKFLLENHDKWTMEQMRSMREFLDSKITSLQKAADENCTIEDFEKAKNEDIDNDNEEGEK